MKYVATNEMLADILTRPLAKHRFKKLTTELPGNEKCQIGTAKSGSVVRKNLLIVLF